MMTSFAKKILLVVGIVLVGGFTAMALMDVPVDQETITKEVPVHPETVK